MKRNFNQTGKSLFKAIYKLRACKHESQRFIICENEQQAEKEILTYDVEYFTVDEIQNDISIVILEKG